MALNEEEESSPVFNDNETPRLDPRAFAQEELVPCEACQRFNPPTRTNCLYCGAVLPITDAAAELIKPTLRPLENWELGFNAILSPSESGSSDVDFRNLSNLLRLDTEDLQAVFSSGAHLPIARCTSHEEATLVQRRLADLGVKVLIVPDTELDAFTPKRIRTLDLTDSSLIVYPTGRESSQSIPWRDLTLIVVGRRIVRRLEVAERADKSRGKEVVASRELITDAERLDVYSTQVESGWRIAADNFDFSCLQEMKTLLASKNFQILTNELRGRAELADYDDSYLRVRQSLSLVWPLEQRTESLGIHKPRMGRINTEAATTSDNEVQFTRYSRLLHHLRLRHLGLNV